MIKAIIFDVDGVLIDSFEANLKFFQDLMIHAGYSSPTREKYKTMFHMTMEEVIKNLVGDKNEDEVKRIWLMGKNHEVPYPYNLIKFPKNCKSVIQRLSNKYILAIVTSRIKGKLFSLPCLSDMENFFKVVVYFEDTTKHKPEPDPLFLACKKLAIKPTETVYIGDANTDIKAARAAGMKVIIYNKKILKEADASTDSFEQIPELVEAIK